MVLASVLMLQVATCIQTRGMLRGSKSAAITGWFIWTAVNVVSLLAQFDAGSTLLELCIPASQLLSTLALLLVAAYVVIRRDRWRDGSDKPINSFDLLALAACVIGIGAWMASG